MKDIEKNEEEREGRIQNRVKRQKTAKDRERWRRGDCKKEREERV